MGTARLARAVSFCDVPRMDPSSPERATGQLSPAKRHMEAIALARRQLQGAPGNAHFLFTLAVALSEADKKDESLFHAEKAAALKPDNPLYAHYAGWLYHEFGLHEFALPLLQRAVKLDPKNVQSLAALAKCHEVIGQTEKAAALLEKALELETDSGRRDLLRLSLARTLAIGNHHPEALAIYQELLEKRTALDSRVAVELAILSKDGPDSKIGKQVAAMVSRSPPDGRERESALLALGNLYNNDKQYDRAFGCWQAAREITRKNVKSQRNHEGLFRQEFMLYRPEVLRDTAQHACQTECVIIICGMPRSGTTLSEQILASHSKAAGAGEVARWEHLDFEFARRHGPGNTVQNLKAAAASGELRERGEEILRILQLMSDSKADRIIEKTPHSFANLGYFRICCPKSRFIHLRRHPLDTFVSTYQNSFNAAHGYAFDQVEYAKEFLFKERVMALWQSLFPESILTISYEDLARDPETHARRMIEFAGLDWEDQCLEFHRGNKSVRTFSTAQVRNPVYSSSIGRWRNYAKHLGPIMNYLEQAGFNYNAANP